MHRRPPRLGVVLLAVLLLAAAGCTSDVEDPPAEGSIAPPVDPACPGELARPLRAWGRAGFSGVVVATEAGEPTCQVAVGAADLAAGRPNDPDAVFGIGSVSKAMTAAAVLDLVAQGRLALDDRAGEHVAGLTGPAAEATVEQLLLHTSGISGSLGEDHQPLTRDEAVTALSASRPVDGADGGAGYRYTNGGATLLALVVEGTTGEEHRDHLLADVLTVDGRALGGFWDGEPAAAGSRVVGYDEDGQPSAVDGSFAGPHWALAGNGDVAMSAVDLARWIHALFSGEVIAPEAVDLLEATTFDHGDGTEEVPGWVRFDATRLGEVAYVAAGGGGDLHQDVVAVWLPESQRVLVIASNTAVVTAEDLLADVAEAFVVGDPLPVPVESAPVDPEGLAAAEGAYSLPDGGRFEVTATDDGLEVAGRGPGAVDALFPPGDDGDAAARREHERRVVALLRGETEAGREELDTLAGDVGTVTDFEVEGTIVADRELRTYVTLVADRDVLAWYAVDDAGAIEAVELTDDPPSLAIIPAGGPTYRPAADDAVPVVLTFGADRVTVTGPDGDATTAPRS